MSVQFSFVAEGSTAVHRAAFFGVDLTCLGARGERVQPGADRTPEAFAKLRELAACAHACAEGGFDFFTLAPSFRTRTVDFGSHDADAVIVGANILEAGCSGHAFLGIPATAEGIAEGLSAVSARCDGRATLDLALDRFTDLSALVAPIAEAHARGVRISARVVADDLYAIDLSALTELVDAVVLSTSDPVRAREVTRAIHEAASDRQVNVLLELGVIISATRRAAIERAGLMRALEGAEPFAGKISSVGTVLDATDTAERLVANGCADGVIFKPGSVLTDLASLLKGVLPTLRARAALEE